MKKANSGKCFLGKSTKFLITSLFKKNPLDDCFCKNTFRVFRSSHQRCSMKKCVLRNFTKFTGKRLCFYVEGIFISKWETHAQASSCEFCEISKNGFFTEHLWKTSSIFSKKMSHIFSGWVFFRLNLKTGNKSELNILNP